MMKRIIALLLALCLICAGFTGCRKNDADKDTSGGKYVGTVTVALDREAAPITVENFVQLANEGFYDGLTFHRIIDGFMMQGGDPDGDGTGGSENTIKGEFTANGVDNNLSHTEGAISMARSQEYDSASSQFFIVHEDSTFLDGDYACFGYVTEGMSIVDKICKNAENTDSNGSVPENKRPVIKSITIREAEISGITYADIVIDYSAVM